MARSLVVVGMLSSPLAVSANKWVDVAGGVSPRVAVDESSIVWIDRSNLTAWTRWTFAAPQNLPGTKAWFRWYTQRAHVDCANLRIGASSQWFYASDGSIVYRAEQETPVESVTPPPGSLGESMMLEICGRGLWRRHGAALSREIGLAARAAGDKREWKQSCSEALVKLGLVNARDRVRELVRAESLAEFAEARVQEVLAMSLALFRDCGPERQLGPRS